MRIVSLMMAAGLALAAGTSASAAETKSLAFRCDAWPAVGYGTPTYWISYSLPVAQSQAVSYCQLYNGTICNYWCQYTTLFP